MKKNTRSTLIAFIFTLSVTGANAQAFTEGFDTLANLASTGWEMFNLSNPAPVSYNWEHGYPANTNTMNPSSVILSGVMMLEYMGWRDAADLITNSVGKTIRNKTVTIDFYNLMKEGTLLKTSEFADEIIRNL